MRNRSSIAANPVLIGAATTLIVIVAVFLAYNANAGLPFVPTYDLTAQVPNAANLVRGNDVRIGGARVGAISDIDVVQAEDGSTSALVKMKLDTSVKPLPEDSTVLIRPRSALGLKYVEITKGQSSEGYDNGAIIPQKQATPKPVEIDEVFNTFDEPTRKASQVNLTEFGTALAGRGQSLNEAIRYLNPLLTNLVPVMRNLSDPRTRLDRFFKELGDAAAIVAPASESQAQLFVNLARTFASLDTVRESIQLSIEGGPPAMRAAIESFPDQRRFLVNSAALFHDLQPGVRALRTAAPDLADAFEVGAPTLERSVALNRRLESLLRTLQDFSEDPQVSLGLKDLQQTVTILTPTVSQLTPAQTVCNYGTLFFRNIGSLLSEGDSNGTWQRFIIVATPAGPQNPNNESGNAARPANGPTVENHLHANPYPNTASPGQSPRECEAGNETYEKGKTIVGNDPGTAPAATEKTVPAQLAKP
jgi:phospholipid/cholesterol/gamma-HCH transport system substrate-binding protein